MGSDSRAEDSLPIISQSPEDAHDGSSPLRFQYRSWLVQEQKECRLGSEFGAHGTDGSVRVYVLLQTAHQETLPDIRAFLGQGNVWG